MTAYDDELTGRMVLGRYRVIRTLARGGMGLVHLGRIEGAAGFARPVILKRILPEMTADPGMTQMFVREAQILAELRHPGIVSVLDFGAQDGAYIMVLEYVHGYDLGSWHKYLRQRKHLMPPEFAVHLSVKVLEALHYAHTLKRPDGTSLQVVHRDISPGNILLDGQGQVKLVDFGVARSALHATDTKTPLGAFTGKVSYAAPELLHSQPASPLTDTYSCAVMLYQLLIGQNPFKGENMADTLQRVLSHVPAPVSEYRSDVTAALDRVLAKALCKAPQYRYPSAAEFAAALRPLLHDSEVEVSQALAQAITSDFNGPMPGALGLEALELRDLAWQQALGSSESLAPQSLLSIKPTLLYRKKPLSPIPESQVTRRPPLSAETLAVSGTPVAARRAKRRRSDATLGAILGLGAALTAFGLLRPASPPSGAELSSPSQQRAQGSRPSEPSAESPAPETASGAPERWSTPRAVLAAHRTRLQGCLQAHPLAPPALALRLELQATGEVAEVHVLPPALEPTPLGDCVRAIAREWHFGPNPSPRQFNLSLVPFEQG